MNWTNILANNCRLKSFALAAALSVSAELHAVVCEMPDSSFLNLGGFVGADAFYGSGICGQGAKVANLELYVASNDEDPEYSIFLKDSNYATYHPESTTERCGSSHPYQTLSIMAGYNAGYENQEVSTGIAYGASYVSGQVGENSLFVTDQLVMRTYEKFFTNGTDVISSSWKNDGASAFMAGTVLDSYALKNTRTVFVGAAANDGGDGPGHVSSPYKNMNVISVGALDDSTGFKTVAGTSSYGPNDFYNPLTGKTVKGVVSAVDIAAPGTVYTVRQNGTLGNDRGTSFAAPIVSSTVALMVSYSKQTSMAEDSRDARLIKAVLLNSASKTAGWGNGARITDSVTANGRVYNGVYSTSQSLDYRSGAGSLDAAETLAQYSNYAQTSFLDAVQNGESRFYDFYADLPGMTLTATLCWYLGSDVSDITYGSGGDISSIDADMSYFSNLDLRLWYIDGGDDALVAQSVSEYNNVEHLFLELAKEGHYRLEVSFEDLIYGDALNETYGIAWNLSTVPEPSVSAVIFGLSVLAFAACRRKK